MNNITRRQIDENRMLSLGFDMMKKEADTHKRQAEQYKAERDELIKLYEVFADTANNNYCVSHEAIKNIYAAISRIKGE